MQKLQEEVCKIANQKFLLDIALDNSVVQTNNRFAKFHYINAKLPEGAFLKLTVPDINIQKAVFDKVYIAAPWLCLYQLTKTYPFHRLALLTMELCGTYALDFNSDIGFCSKLKPILNEKILQKTYQHLSGQRIGKSKTFIDLTKCISNNSASPAESKLYLLLCGPRKYGFFQCHKLSLNKKVQLSKKASVICGYSQLRPDLSSIDKKLAIEYDSKQFHEKVERNQNDKARSLALYHDGWNVVTIVPAELMNFNKFYTIAEDILKYLGQDSRIKSKKFYQRSRDVFADFTK